MTILEDTMKEVLLSDKEIIEKQSNIIFELEERVKELENINKTLLTKLKIYEESDIVETITNSSLYKDIIKERDKYKNDFEKINLRVQELENKNSDEDLSSEVKIAVDEALNKQNKELNEDFNKRFNIYKEEQENKYNSLYNEFSNFKNNVGIPTPSNSKDFMKKNNKKSKINNEKILLPDNILEVVYYRNTNNNNFLPGYHTTNGIHYLECCGKQWDYKPIGNNGVTCLKCYKTYKLDNNKKLIKNILPEHVISNEKEILNKIKCNNKRCDYIYKKEINLCYNCKNIENVKIVEYPMPDINDEAYETKIALAGKCHNSIMYTSGIFEKAHKEGLVKNGWSPLITYIKNNKLMEEKQINIIKNKIIRCNDIKFIYNLDKYKCIQDFIKRLYFSLNSIAKLKDDDFQSFKYDLTEKLDNYLEKNNFNSNEKIIIDNNNNINLEKINNIINKNYLYKSNKDEKLCILENCNNKRQVFGDDEMGLCKQHFENSLKF